MNLKLSAEALAEAASKRGLSLSAFFEVAGVDRRTMAKVNRGEPIRSDAVRRLDEALARIPELEHIEFLREPA